MYQVKSGVEGPAWLRRCGELPLGIGQIRRMPSGRTAMNHQGGDLAQDRRGLHPKVAQWLVPVRLDHPSPIDVGAKITFRQSNPQGKGAVVWPRSKRYVRSRWTSW